MYLCADKDKDKDKDKEGFEMKVIVIAFALLVSTAAFGNGLAEIDRTERCAAWVRNAMHGATQSMRGAAREVQYIARSALHEMLMRSGGVTNDKIYILADDNYSEEEREFLEESTLFGYDAMSRWKSRNADTAPSRDEWQRHLTATCLEYETI